jgi:hypothetical protein
LIVTNFFLRRLIYRSMCGLVQTFDLALMHPVRELSRLALADTLDYIHNHMVQALGLEMGQDVLEFALSQVRVPGHYLEFGVFKGDSIKFLAKRIGDNRIHGFDSFEGLPKEWSGFKMDTSTLNLRGKLPRVPKTVQLHPGWFDQTIPAWLSANEGPLAFIHVDCDIYVSTQIIFDLLAPRIQPGTVIVFDEYFNYPNWQHHEFKAFQEFVIKTGAQYEYLAYARNQVAVRILKIGG